MNILITAPSLDESENVSGISTIVKTVIKYNKSNNEYFHFKIGNRDGEKKGLKWIVNQLMLLPRMSKYIHQNHIEVIHLNTAFTKAALIRDFIIIWYLKSIISKSVLLHIHGGYLLMNPPRVFSIFRFMIDYILNHADTNVVLSKLEQEQLHTTFGVNSKVLPNAVPPSPNKFFYKKFSNKIKFIFLGRIVQSKGIFLIVEALKQLTEYHSDFNFTLYGTGPEVKELLKKLSEIDTLDYAYKGIAMNSDKWKAFSEANVFLLPSINGEGLPIAMLEAMQSGCIPVVSDDASITTVVKNAVNGFVVKKGSQEELYITLKKILTDRKNLEQMSTAAMSTVSDSYNISTYLRTLSSYYATLTQQKNR